MFSSTNLKDTLVPYPCTTLLPLTTSSTFKFCLNRSFNCSYTSTTNPTFLPLFLHLLSLCLFLILQSHLFMLLASLIPSICMQYPYSRKLSTHSVFFFYNQYLPIFSFTLINNSNTFLITYVSSVVVKITSNNFENILLPTIKINHLEVTKISCRRLPEFL